MNRAARIIVFLFMLLILAVGAAGYFSCQYWKVAREAPADTGSVATPDEVAETVALVSRHVLLPTDETPTVATITDTESLQGQEFFKNAKIGHKVLVYSEARLAILYDASLDRVVNMAQLNPEAADIIPAGDAEAATTTPNQDEIGTGQFSPTEE